MAENKTKDPAADFTVDEISSAYRDGDITAKQKNDLLHRKAKANLAEQVAEAGLTGLPMLMLKKTIEEAQEGWNEFVAEVGRVKPEDEGIGLKLKAGGATVLAGVKMASSLFTAIGEVSGQQAENTALKLGASPGWAKAINVAVDVGTGFVPVGFAARTTVAGVQKGMKALGKAGKTAGKAADLGSDAARISQQVLEAGLQADGVKTAEVVSKHITGLEKTIQEAVEATEKVIPKAATEAVEKTGKTKFAEKFLEYKREMAAITETKTHEMTLKEAEKLGLGLDDLRNLTPGTALKESEMAAYLKALDEPVDELVTLAKAAVKGGTDEAQQFANKAMEFFQYSPKFRAAEVTAGRSVEILKETPPMKSITDMLTAWDVESMAKGDFTAAMRTMAENVVDMSDDTNKLKSLQVQGGTHWQNFKENGWPMVREAYTNLLLARPLTHVRNFIGNSVAATNAIAERQIAGWLSIDKAKGVQNGEGVLMAKGMMYSIGDGLKAFGKAFEKQISPDDLGKFDFMPHKIPGMAGNVINVPGDTLRGADNFFKTILQRGDNYAMALRNGIQHGLHGDDLAKYVAERSWNPTASMITHAKDFAMSGTFQDDLGTLGKAMQKGLQAGPMALWFPFMKTPINLAKYAWNRTPGLQMLSSSLYKDIAAGGAQADMAIARLTLSNLTGMFVYGLAQEGLITGGGPSDPGLKRSWELTKHPYSIAGKDGWHPYSNMDPATTPIALMADFAEIGNQMDEPGFGQMASALMLGGVRDIADKSWWQTVGKLIDITSDIRAGEGITDKALKMIASPFTTVASGGPLGQSITRAIEDDPIRKDVRGILDDYRSKIPGFGSMPPMRDGLGEPVLVPQAIGGPWVGIGSPILEKPFNEDRIAKEAARLQIRMPKWPDSIGGKQQSDFDVNELQPGDSLPVGLSPQEKDRWGEIHKKLLRNPETGMEKLLDSEEYQAQPQAGQRAIFMQTLSGYRASAMQILETENGGDLMKRKIDATAGKYLPMTPAEQRPEVKQAFEDAKSEVDVIAPEAQENLMRWGILD
jgi:hypothetical protein